MATKAETRLQKKIQDDLEEQGCWVHKNHGNQYSTAGLPDLTVIYRGTTVWLEVKTPTGKLSEIQKEVINSMRDHGAWVAVVDSVEEARYEVFERMNF